jgi:hypothetical protein
VLDCLFTLFGARFGCWAANDFIFVFSSFSAKTNNIAADCRLRTAKQHHKRTARKSAQRDDVWVRKELFYLFVFSLFFFAENTSQIPLFY